MFWFLFKFFSIFFITNLSYNLLNHHFPLKWQINYLHYIYINLLGGHPGPPYNYNTNKVNNRLNKLGIKYMMFLSVFFSIYGQVILFDRFELDWLVQSHSCFWWLSRPWPADAPQHRGDKGETNFRPDDASCHWDVNFPLFCDHFR